MEEVQQGWTAVHTLGGGFGEDVPPQGWTDVHTLGGHGEVVPQGWTAVRTLGRGGFGEVKLLVNNNNNNTAPGGHQEDAVAMKVLDTSRGCQWAESAAREARLHRALQHPNVVRFLGHQRRGPNAYLFLEHCGGGELFERLAPDVGLGDEGRALRYFGQLIAAVEYLHGAGVTHRDIKPENILLDARDNLKLADFGLAAAFRRKGDGAERLFGSRCGSHEYMAPEVLLATGQEGGERRWFRARPVDVWACGVVLVAMLTGELPWERPADSCQEYLDWLDEKTYLSPWNRIRPSPLSLLAGLLLDSAEERISIADVKRHRWLVQTTHAAG